MQMFSVAIYFQNKMERSSIRYVTHYAHMLGLWIA